MNLVVSVSLKWKVGWSKIKLGLIVPLKEKPDEELKRVHMPGFPTCQVSCWNANLYTSDIAYLPKKTASNYGVEITAIWAGLPGKYIWNSINGPNTIGLVPPEKRGNAFERPQKASNFTKEVNVENIVTHVGFIPENPRDPILP